MMLNRIISVFILLLTINGCSYVPTLDDVIPDRRTEYRKSQALPDLEVPPDLTTEALQDPLVIPNEEVTTLSEYERRRSTRGTTGVVGAAGVDILVDEQWLLVQGNVAGIWPELREFWIKKGYTLDLDDPELGVMETGWLETGSDGITVFRDKFSLFTEAGNAPDTTIIFIKGEKQEKIASSENDEWISIGESTELEKQMVSELNLFFYGGEAPAGASSLTVAASSGTAGAASTAAAAAPSITGKPRAEMLNLGDDKVYLSLPHEFTRAWTLTEDAILKTGMFIENNDRDKGIYYVLYFDQQQEEEGMLSKLKFWKDDEPQGQEYQLSLTGVGDKTELVVLDNKGDWADRQQASKILTYIQVQYNNAIR
jgi:outer membrane protein assembly factor BamC